MPRSPGLLVPRRHRTTSHRKHKRRYSGILRSHFRDHPRSRCPRNRCGSLKMPRVPGINHLEAARALKKAGFSVARQGKKHIVMSDGTRFLTIPRHNPNQCLYDGWNRPRCRAHRGEISSSVVNLEVRREALNDLFVMPSTPPS